MLNPRDVGGSLGGIDNCTGQRAGRNAGIRLLGPQPESHLERVDRRSDAATVVVKVGNAAFNRAGIARGGHEHAARTASAQDTSRQVGEHEVRTVTETTLPRSRARAQESRAWGVTPVGKVVSITVL